MSEYTDYMALLTDAASLQALRGQLEEVVPWAHVELNFINETGEVPPEAQWAALPKPAWVTMSTPATADALAPLGTVLHLMAEEDFQSWGMEVLCGGEAWAYAMRAGPVAAEGGLLNGYPVLADPLADPSGVADLAACLAVDAAALTATLVPDGGQSFSAALGIQYYVMQDQTLADPPATGRVQFHTMFEG